MELDLSTRAKCETVVRRGLQTFREVGTALTTIRDHPEWWRTRYPTFEQYCRATFEISRSYAYDLMNAADVCAIVDVNTNGRPGPQNEATARELAPMRGDPDELRAAWAEATSDAAQEGRAPTSTDVRRAVRGRTMGDVVPAPSEPAPGSQEKVAEIVEGWAKLCNLLGILVRLEREAMMVADFTDNQRWQIDEAKKHAWMRMDNER